MRDHPHSYDQDSEVCSHCGQPLVRPGPHYEREGSKRGGLIGTIALHLLLLAIFIFKPPEKEQKTARPASDRETDVFFVQPLQQPTKAQREQKPKPAPKPTPRRETPRPTPPERVIVKRLPDTITIPDEKPVERRPPPPQPPQPKTEVPPDMDMAAYVKAQRERRGAPTGSEVETPESDAVRGNRNALANIAAINGRGRDDSNESGGIFSISNKTFNTMDLKFRGWNPSFKRRWLTAVTVEQGSARDIETAVIKKMIELIRKEKTGDFEWDSHRLGRVVKLSARPADEARLTEFLYKEMFPEYRPPPGG